MPQPIQFSVSIWRLHCKIFLLLAVSQDCNFDQFQCDNRQCIGFDKRCDCTEQCLDGSDEADCEDSGTTATCDSGECIIEPYWCDCFEDCPDGSDEVDCPNSDCPRCADTGKVYFSSQRCNCDEDCDDGSDEANCDDDPLNKRFECGEAQCTIVDKRCDQYRDCINGADEDNCESKKATEIYLTYCSMSVCFYYFYKPAAKFCHNALHNVYEICSLCLR